MLNYEEIKNLIHLFVQTPYKSVSFKYGSLELNLDRDDLNNEGSINQVVPNNSINEIQKHIAETVIKKPIEINEQKTITEKESTKYKEIVAPMVGTFYSKPSPESEPFVKVGDVVSKGYTVCILEAMKLYNEIESEIDGEIAEVLIKDGELVEYGQPLFLIK